MAKKIIALNSIRGRSGKDTLIEQLTMRGYKVHRVAFADALKEECSAALADTYRYSYADLLEFSHGPEKDIAKSGLSIREIPEGAYKRFLMFECKRPEGSEQTWMNAPRSMRWHLQKYGTEYRREYLGNPDLWLNEGLKRINAKFDLYAPDNELVVVTDLRLKNEYEALKPLGYSVRIHRMWFDQGIDTTDYHVSDVDLLGARMDAVVLNKWGSPDEMVDQLLAQGVL